MSDNTHFKLNGKTRVHFKELLFKPMCNQIIYYDPNVKSEFSEYIEQHLQEIKDFFGEINFEFCYLPEICKQMTAEQVRYRFPDWNGESLSKVGSDFLKPYLSEEDRDIGACFIRLFDYWENVFSCFQLQPLSQFSWTEQLDYYKKGLLKTQEQNDDGILFRDAEDSELYSAYEKKFCFADDRFNWTTIDTEIKKLVNRLHKDGVEEFVLRCMVPIENKLSRIIITPRYEIMLPDYGNQPIKMSPLPKAVFLLFLRHEEGIYFKELVDYKEELQYIYSKITNRLRSKIISGSIEKVTDPTQNAINEKCSRIREAFLARMDEKIAQQYYITGKRGDRKRITLPRDLVEWQCKL